MPPRVKGTLGTPNRPRRTAHGLIRILKCRELWPSWPPGSCRSGRGSICRVLNGLGPPRASASAGAVLLLASYPVRRLGQRPRFLEVLDMRQGLEVDHSRAPAATDALPTCRGVVAERLGGQGPQVHHSLLLRFLFPRHMHHMFLLLVARASIWSCASVPRPHQVHQVQ